MIWKVAIGVVAATVLIAAMLATATYVEQRADCEAAGRCR